MEQSSDSAMTPATTATELRRQLDRLAARNAQLITALSESRDRLAQLSADIAALAEPASSYGIFLGYSSPGHDKQREAEIFANGRLMRVKISPNLPAGSITVGQQVRLGEGMVIVEAIAEPATGVLTQLTERIGPDRAVVSTHSGDEHLIILADKLRDTTRAGDTVLTDIKAGVAVEKVEVAEVSQLFLEEVPSVSFSDIGGLDAQITQIRDAVELPFLHPQLYRDFQLHPPKGVLLYGPPGCGKTLIAKAVAHSLARRVGEGTSSYFLNVKGPELLNKYVGETERRIRLIFERARELAADGSGQPVIVFFDEMESIFRTRGSGVSSDMETTIVPQLLTELDGVEDLRNVIIIGATNREELIDPAIMRPGRLDIKIRVNRPTKTGARDILRRHFPESLPHSGSYDQLLDTTIEQMYSDRPFVRLHLSTGDSTVLHYRDFVSGAMIANVVARAKKLAIKEALASGSAGAITQSHLSQALAAEQADSEHVPAATSAGDWAKIVGGDAGGGTVVSVDLLGYRSPTWHVL